MRDRTKEIKCFALAFQEAPAAITPWWVTKTSIVTWDNGDTTMQTTIVGGPFVDKASAMVKLFELEKGEK